MSRIAEERETIVRFDESSEIIDVWSVSPAFQRHMTRLGLEPVNVSQGERPGEQSMTWRLPTSWLAIRKPRQVSAAQKARIAAIGRLTLKRNRAEQKNGAISLN